MQVKHVRAAMPRDVNFNSIVIAFSHDNYKKLRKSKYFCEISYRFKAEVKFELKYLYFYRLHNAIQHLPWEVIKKLTPTLSAQSKKTHIVRSQMVPAPKYECIDLDEGQMKALEVIIKSTPDLPVLVAGPFGTGKTRLLARTAYEVLKERNSRVLICAHHQASVDTFVEKYFGPMIENPINPWAVHMIRVIPNNSYHSKARNHYKHFFKPSYKLSTDDLIENRLVITTLGMAQKLHYQLPKDKKKDFFTHILIDEGAQTREPETVCPLCLAGRNTQIVITGDHLQVRFYFQKDLHSNDLFF